MSRELPTRATFQLLAQQRIIEARTLLDTNVDFAAGAYYLAGYAVECALKAYIVGLSVEVFYARSQGNSYLTHNLKQLLDYSGLTIPDDRRINWSLVQEWDEQSRYTRKSEDDARQLLEAIDDSQKGILPWLAAQW